MIITARDLFKLIGMTIVCTCAVFVCNLFINFLLDLSAIETLISDPMTQGFFNAQKTMATVICCVTGGVLGLTSVVVLFFHIKQYVDSH